MRYYSIQISDTSGTPVYPPGFSSAVLGNQTYGSYVGNQTLPGAWDVELDIAAGAFGQPGEAGAFVRIWGISLQEIAQAKNLTGFNIKVYGGFKPGLPLATAASGQAGLLTQGQIQPAFGNWIETDQTLDLLIVPNAGNSAGPGSPAKPVNLVLNWLKGTQLSAALQTTLQTAFPNASPAPTISISQNLVAPQDIHGVYGDLSQLAAFVRETSRAIVGGNYPGVSIYPSGGSFSASDTTVSNGTVKQLNFQDLIGQPTWIASPLIQIKTMMRGDLSLGGQIKLPPGVLTTTTPQSQSQYRQASVFQGTFYISNLRHVGRYRQADGSSWVTIIEAAPQPQ